MRKKASSKALEICVNLQKTYENDFEGWVREFINFDGLKLPFITDQQIDIGNTLVEDRFLAIAGGGGLGKTATAALLILWFLTTHPFSKIPTTAPNGHLLRDILWSEIPFWVHRCKLKNLFDVSTQRISVKGFPNWFAVARTVPKDTKKDINDTLAGFHAPYLFIVVDEASGVPDPVFTALDGAMTSENSYILLISNPVSTAGYYYNIMSGTINGTWTKRFYSSKESSLVDAAYEQRIIETYGKESGMYKAKVLGKLIELSDGIIVSPQKYDEVLLRNREFQEGSIVLGIDVGGSSDSSVICHRQGNSVIAWDIFPRLDTDDLVEKVEGIWRFKYKQKQLTAVVDAIGKGDGVYTKLNKKGLFEVIGHIGSEKAVAEKTYENKRTELYDKVSRDFENLHFPVPPPEKLKKQLTNIRFDYSKERVALEDKRTLIRRLGSSPDEADALSLTEAVKIVVRKKSSFVPKRVSKYKRVVSRGNKYGKFSKFV